MAKRKQLRSSIAWSTTEQIGVYGYDLCQDLIGKVTLGDMAFLEITGRLPQPKESKMFEAIAVTLVEHGVNPSSLAARLTYDGAPEALQAAVAAGLLGLGNVFVGSTETAARMLSSALQDEPDTAPLEPIAERIVEHYMAAKTIIPGIGHPKHKPLDPRAVRLMALAREYGYAGRHVQLMEMVTVVGEKAYKRPLPMNATGAIGSICCELGFPLSVVRGVGVMARAVGLVGHILEESKSPMGFEIYMRTEEEAATDIIGKLRSDR